MFLQCVSAYHLTYCSSSILALHNSSIQQSRCFEQVISYTHKPMHKKQTSTSPSTRVDVEGECSSHDVLRPRCSGHLTFACEWQMHDVDVDA